MKLMQRIKIFISSVQNEFSEERKMLYEYFLADPLLGKFFQPFLFEQLPATDQKIADVYLKEVELCDIYLGFSEKIMGLKITMEFLLQNENLTMPQNTTKHASYLLLM